MKLNKTSKILHIATAVGSLLTLLLLAACSGAVQPPAATGGETEAAPGTPPTLRLTVPAADAIVPAGTVSVAVETTGLKYVMPSNTNVAGEGHVHFTLDDRPFIMSTTPNAELTDVEPGTHTLVAELVQTTRNHSIPPSPRLSSSWPNSPPRRRGLHGPSSLGGDWQKEPREPMDAVHIKTSGFYCKACPKVVEKALSAVTGVEDVVSVRSMGLTSVLFDSDVVDAALLCSRIRAAGFGAEIHCPHPEKEFMQMDDSGRSPRTRDTLSHA